MIDVRVYRVHFISFNWCVVRFVCRNIQCYRGRLLDDNLRYRKKKCTVYIKECFFECIKLTSECSSVPINLYYRSRNT